MAWETLQLDGDPETYVAEKYNCESLQDAISPEQAADLLDMITEIVPNVDLSPLACDSTMVSGPTNGHAEKKKKKPRMLNKGARECIRKFKEYQRNGDPQDMKYVVREYVSEHPEESESGLYRRLTDNSQYWKRT